MRYFYVSHLVTVIGLFLAYQWGGLAGLGIAALLMVMEITLSFDNAVVNASVLKHMDEIWQKRFLTWGILIAVFGMRLLFPIVIVALATGLGAVEVLQLAIDSPEEYSRHVLDSHVQIASFGGMLVLYVMVKSITALCAGSEDAAHGATKTVAYTGFMGFMYLQLLDASFSLDGVIGAFAMSKDIIIIMLGLGIGAMFVRSLTIYLVKKGTLSEYIYLEHGAHYGIGALALIMLVSMLVHVPEFITGFIGLSFILLSLWSSLLHRKKESLMKS
jgi:hypothetical protein